MCVNVNVCACVFVQERESERCAEIFHKYVLHWTQQESTPLLMPNHSLTVTHTHTHTLVTAVQLVLGIGSH